MGLHWIRPRFPLGQPTARPARIELYALLAGANLDAALERARDEVGDDAAWDALEIDVRARASDRSLDQALAGRPGMTLADRPEDERLDVHGCQRYATVRAALHDPPSMVALQAALALLRALAEEGDLLCALDRSTARWWSPGELTALSPERRFDLDEHVQVVVEAQERRPGAGHVIRSRGLAKFARPDVAGRAPRRDAPLISEIVRDVARLLAEGVVLRPGEPLAVRELPPITLVARTDDCLADAPADTAPVYELRDLTPAGPGPSLATVLGSHRPKKKLSLLK